MFSLHTFVLSSRRTFLPAFVTLARTTRFRDQGAAVRARLSQVLVAFGIVSFNLVEPASALTVGTLGGSGSSLPFNNNVSGSSAGQALPAYSATGTYNLLYFQIYDASAFPGAISFDTITFFANGTPPVYSGNYEISFGVTSSPLYTSYPFPTASDVSVFYDGNLASPSVTSSFSISGTQYTYDPSLGNLWMRIVVTNQAYPAPNVGGFVTDSVAWADLVTTGIWYGNFDSVIAVQGLVTQFDTAVTPLPAALPLFTTALMGLGMAGWRRKRTTTAASR